MFLFPSSSWKVSWVSWREPELSNIAAYIIGEISRQRDPGVCSCHLQKLHQEKLAHSKLMVTWILEQISVMSCASIVGPTLAWQVLLCILISLSDWRWTKQNLRSRPNHYQGQHCKFDAEQPWTDSETGMSSHESRPVTCSSTLNQSQWSGACFEFHIRFLESMGSQSFRIIHVYNQKGDL